MHWPIRANKRQSQSYIRIVNCLDAQIGGESKIIEC